MTKRKVRDNIWRNNLIAKLSGRRNGSFPKYFKLILFLPYTGQWHILRGEAFRLEPFPSQKFEVIFEKFKCSR